MAKRRKRKPRNPHKRREWRSMFRVEMVQERATVKFGFFNVPTKQMVAFYQIVENDTDEVVGKYNDYIYACKQAWYKYKKRLRKVEKILLDE